MTKKDLANVTADLSQLASMMPTQKPAAVPVKSDLSALTIVATPKPKPEDEEVTQFSLSLRRELRKQLSRLADDADMTMRAFVLNALMAKGLAVREDDLADLRKERR